MATLAKKTSIYTDVKATHEVSEVTLASYIEVLEKLFVLKDIDAWTPQIRSKTSIRSAKKHIFVDPSIGLAALGISPESSRSDISGAIAATDCLRQCSHGIYNRKRSEGDSCWVS